MLRNAGCAPLGVYVQNVIGTSCEALGSGNGNAARISQMSFCAAARSVEATETLRCELQRSTWSREPLRSKSALSPASDDDRRTASPSVSGGSRLVATRALRTDLRP